ncbi:MAG: TatD family hydrolase, partial [Planctomycetota bacterium]|nr:TatD family hydrolase [Planctomycetota bacterium]
MELFDTHTHLNDEQFNNIVDQTICRANEQFVTYILVVGTTVVDSRRAVEIARKFPNVYAAVGIQPNYVSEAKSTDFDEIKSLA